MMYSLNSNIDVDGKRYHVQTEKLGWQIVTLVFEGGAVIARHKKDLSEMGAVEMSPNECATFMKAQHQAVISEIRSHNKTVNSNGQANGNGQTLEDVVCGPSTLPGTRPKKVPNNDDSTKSDDLISKFLNEWADEEEPEKK